MIGNFDVDNLISKFQNFMIEKLEVREEKKFRILNFELKIDVAKF